MRLEAVIVWRLADGPMSYDALVHLLRWRYPRVLPDAIDTAISRLSRMNFIEHRRGKWRVASE